MTVKRIDIKEFRDRGYLQEANRLFFHPLGLALEAIIDQAGEGRPEGIRLGGVWDDRDDPEGRVFTEFDPEKAEMVAAESEVRREARANLECCDKNGIQIRNFNG